MYNRVILIPYKMGSSACKALKDALLGEGINCIRRTVDSNKPVRNTDLLIYYGGSDHYQSKQGGRMNSVRDVAQDKLLSFQRLREADLSTVEWTTSQDVASTWPVVVCRTTLTGHSGQGIIIYESEANPLRPLPNARLYTKYMKKTFECRIHVMNGTVIDAQIKRKKQGVEDVNNHVRNVHTGWVYCRGDYRPDEAARNLAIAACGALSLDFGAVDLIYNQHYNKYYILEVNTAPGLEGTTLSNYVQGIKNVCIA